MVGKQELKRSAAFHFNMGDFLSKLNRYPRFPHCPPRLTWLRVPECCGRFSEAIGYAKRALEIDEHLWLAYGSVIAW